MNRPGTLTTAVIALPLAGALVGLAFGLAHEWAMTRALDALSDPDVT